MPSTEQATEGYAQGQGPAGEIAAVPTAASAMWAQREALSENRAGIIELLEAVGRPEQFSLAQAMTVLALSLEFRPDLILELGRGHGNSTAVSTAAANLLGPHNCHVTSLCLTSFWQLDTAPRLRRIRGDGWFEPLSALRADIRAYDYRPLLSDRERVLIFWDAHGYDIAECVLGGILPLLSGKAAYLLVHDMSDARYLDPTQLAYGNHGLWRRNDWSGRRIQLGDVFSNVEQAVAVVDFAARNHLELRSVTHSLRTGLSPSEIQQLDEAVGLQLAAADVGLYSLSFSGSDAPSTFPRFDRPGLISRLRSSLLIDAFLVARRLRLDGIARKVLRTVRRIRFR